MTLGTKSGIGIPEYSSSFGGLVLDSYLLLEEAFFYNDILIIIYLE
jgi:hypothetical protein